LAACSRRYRSARRRQVQLNSNVRTLIKQQSEQIKVTKLGYVATALLVGFLLTLGLVFLLGRSIFLIIGVLLAMLTVEQISTKSSMLRLIRLGLYVGLALGWLFVIYGPLVALG